MPGKRHLITLAILMVTMLVGIGVGFSRQKSLQIPQTTPQITSNPSVSPAMGGAFVLTSVDGKTVTEQSLVGKYHALFFGYANCPDICPGTLQTMAGIFEAMPAEKRDKLQMIFISVDPARDTLAKLGTYVRSFHPNFIGWTGTKAQIDAMARNYLAYYALDKQDENGDYAVNHSSFMYLTGPDGKVITHLRSSDSAAAIRAELERFIQ